jgi:hypothetical protein
MRGRPRLAESVADDQGVFIGASTYPDRVRGALSQTVLCLE